MKNKRHTIILAIVLIILFIPLLAMQFTNEVNWTFFDFVIAGLLLFGTGLLVEITLRKVKNSNYRILAIISIVLLLLLIWAELAIGIFETIVAGN